MIEPAGDGHLVIQDRWSTQTTLAAPLDFNFQLRGKIVELATDKAHPVSVGTQPIKSNGRGIDAVVPLDATHAILVFRTTRGAVSTQRLEVTSDFHNRAAAR